MNKRRSKDRSSRTPPARPAPATTRAPTSAASGGATELPVAMTPEAALALRELFWHNVIREMLSGLASQQEAHPELFDGRFAVLTRGSTGGQPERIPIGGVTPMFACSVPGSSAERDASQIVQCSVFQVRTPMGEVFTLPLMEIRAIHALTPELIEKLQQAAEAIASTQSGRGGAGAGGSDDDPGSRPFGLAAFAALPKPSRLPAGPAPESPTE
jgi:hypothetical protein